MSRLLFIRLVNRNLQVTLLAGAAILAVLAGGLEFDSALSSMSLADMVKLLVLSGLPIMLLVRGGSSRSTIERVLARATATFLCVGALTHTIFSEPHTWPFFVTLLLVVMGQVTVMRCLDTRAQLCT